MADQSSQLPELSRGALIAGGLAASVVFSAMAGGVFLAVSDYDVTSPKGAGAYLGRIGSQTQLLDVAPSEPGLPLWAVIGLQIPLWIGLLGATWLAARRTMAGLKHELWFAMVPADIPVGLAIGVFAQVVVVPLIYIPIIEVFGEQDLSGSARALTDRADSPLAIGLLVLGVGLIAPVVEELFFRGLVLRSFQRGLSTPLAVVASSAVFGAIHFQLRQFPGLFAIGAIVAVLAVKAKRLGPAIWAHIGFNMTTLVVLVAGA